MAIRLWALCASVPFALTSAVLAMPPEVVNGRVPSQQSQDYFTPDPADAKPTNLPPQSLPKLPAEPPLGPIQLKPFFFAGPTLIAMAELGAKESYNSAQNVIPTPKPVHPVSRVVPMPTQSAEPPVAEKFVTSTSKNLWEAAKKYQEAIESGDKEAIQQSSKNLTDVLYRTRDLSKPASEK
jgi:hypothetical protein